MFIPNHVYKSIDFDNNKFLNEKLVNTDSFFSTTAELIKCINMFVKTNG